MVLVVAATCGTPLAGQGAMLSCRITPTPGTGPATGVAITGDRSVWTVDVNSGRLLRFDSTGSNATFVHAGSMQRQKVTGVARGPGDAVWYLTADGTVGRLDADGGGATESTVQERVGLTRALRRAPDGSLWFLDVTRDRIGHVALDGTVRLLEPPAGLGRRVPGRPPRGEVLPVTPWPKSMNALAVAPDGALWISSNQDDALFRIVPGDVPDVRRYVFPTPRAQVDGMHAADDGAVWIAMFGSSRLGVIPLAAAAIREFALDVRPQGVLAAGDGGAWFTTQNTVGRLRADGSVTQASCERTLNGPLFRGPDGMPWVIGNQVLVRVDTGGTRRVATTTRRVAARTGTPTARARPVATDAAVRAPGFPMNGYHPVEPASLDSALAESSGHVVVLFSSDDGECTHCLPMNDTFQQLIRDTKPDRVTFMTVHWNPWRAITDDPVARGRQLTGLPAIVHYHDRRELGRVYGNRSLTALKELLGYTGW
jgi:streptogramin lyase